MSYHFPDFSGRTIDQGRLQLLQLIGRGGYSVVHQAVDTTLALDKPQYYSVKCLFQPSTDKERQMQSQEFAYHKLVSPHPHVVTIHKILSDDTFVYVVLDYLPGDLFSAIASGLFENKNAKVRTVFSQLASAVQWCHYRGVFHRDIKPENILCDEHCHNIYLADFGLATSDILCSNFGVGSGSYMSPECLGMEIKLKEYCCRGSDVWSLGIILCNLISGQNPWKLAVTDDPRFSLYLHTPDSHRQNLGLSTAVADVLNRVFTINPFTRISLPDLVAAVAEVNNFYAHVDPVVEHAVKLPAIVVTVPTPTGQQPHRGAHKGCLVKKQYDYDVSDWDSPLEENDDEYYAFNAPLPTFSNSFRKIQGSTITVPTCTRRKAPILFPSFTCFSFPHRPRRHRSVSSISFSSGVSSVSLSTPPECASIYQPRILDLDKCMMPVDHTKESVTVGKDLFKCTIEKH